MAGKTRLGEGGYGERPYLIGGFAGKTPDAGSAHPVGIITRLSLDGYGARRYAINAFAGKTSGGAGTPDLPHSTYFFADFGRMMGR